MKTASVDVILAWRNLWRQKRRTWLTLAAMVFSNFLLVFMVSLQAGSYTMMITNSLKAFSAHLQIQHPEYLDDQSIRHSVPDILAYAQLIRKKLPNSHVSARALGFAMVSSRTRSIGVQVAGVDGEHEPNVSSIPGLLKTGHFFRGIDGDSAIIGSVLARNLQLEVGDEITLLGSGYDGSMAVSVLTVDGIFESGIAELDRLLIEIPIKTFQTVFSMGNHGHGIIIEAPKLADVDEQKQFLLKEVSNELAVRDWNEIFPGLMQAIQADMASAAFMYFILVILVAFSVLNTQLMSVLERTREFGVMLALGVKPWRLVKLVVMETSIMAWLGLVIGVFLGFLLTLYLSFYGFSYPGMEEMGKQFNIPSRIYPSISTFSLLLGPCVVFMGCILATLYPALKIFYLTPIKAMRAV